jgi:hypothetical protein
VISQNSRKPSGASQNNSGVQLTEAPALQE